MWGRGENVGCCVGRGLDMFEHVRVAGKNQYDTVATDRRAVGAGLVRAATVAGRGAEKRGRRSVVLDDFITFRRWRRSGGGRDTPPVVGTRRVRRSRSGREDETFEHRVIKVSSRGRAVRMLPEITLPSLMAFRGPLAPPRKRGGRSSPVLEDFIGLAPVWRREGVVGTRSVRSRRGTRS